MSTLTATQLQQQYIAYFGRPGDPAGIKYWLSSSSGISSAREFADKIYAQDEYKNSTVGTKSTEAQVNSLYQNLFGRESDAAGLIYWTGQIEAGILTLSNIAYDLIAAASNPVAGNETQGAADALALSNKVSAATAFTADVEASTNAILAYQPESSSPWVTGAAFESGKTYLTGITTTAHSAAGIDSAVASMITANTTAGSTVAGSTSKFTTSTDALVGGAGADIFNGVLQGDAESGTTIAPGDSVDGKGGTDSISIAVAGTLEADYTLSAVTTTGVETVTFSNFQTDDSYDVIFDAALADSSLTTVGNASSSGTGDTQFTGLKEIVDAKLFNGAGDLKLTYNSTVVSGTADVQNVAISNLTGGIFTADGIETLAITTSLVKSTGVTVASNALKKVTVEGSADLTVGAIDFASNGSATKPGAVIDASTFTGKLDVTTTASEVLDIKGGTGADTFTLASLTKNDTIDGGAGSDTIEVDAANFDTEFTKVSNVENVTLNDTGAALTLNVSKLSAGVTGVTVTLKDDATGAGALASTISGLTGETLTITRADEDADVDGKVDPTITPKVDTESNTLDLVVKAIGTDGDESADTDGDENGLGTIDVANYETLNLSSKTSSDGTTTIKNEIDAITATKATTINVSGDAELQLDSLSSGALTKFDASSLAAKLAVTFTGDKVAVTAAQKDSTIAFGSTLDNNDSVVGGAGTQDEVTATFASVGETAGTLTISAVETITLSNSGTNTFDFTSVTGATTISSTGGTNTIKGFDLGATLESTAAQTFKVTGADVTGSADVLKVSSVASNSNEDNTIEAVGIETLEVTVKDTSSNSSDDTRGFDLDKFEGTTVKFSQSSTSNTAGNVIVDLAGTTLHKNVTSVDSTGLKDNFTADASNATSAVTFDLSGGGIQSVTGGSKADTFNIAETGAVDHVLTGGSGTDIANISIKNGYADPSSIGIEDVTYTIKAGDNVTLTDQNTTTTTALTLKGGNSISTFTTDTDGIRNELKTFNSADFLGNVDLLVTKNLIDDTIVFTAGSHTQDEIQYTIDITGTDKLYSTGIDILDLDINEVSTLDLENATGVKTIDVDLAEAAKVLTITKMSGENVLVVAGAADSDVTPTLADATGSADTLNIELKDAGSDVLKADFDINTADIETVTIKASTAESIDLSGLSMTTTDEVMTLKVTGDKALTVSALGTDVTTVDASGMTEGGSFIQTGRTSTVVATYTGSVGNDTFIMTEANDVIAAGGQAATGGDTLDINYFAVIGGMNVDLSSTGDQVTSWDGLANTVVQSGFENVELSGVTGKGAVITGSDGVNRIAGTAEVDTIKSGKGNDTIVLVGNDSDSDVIDGGTGTNTIEAFSGTATLATDTNLTNVTEVLVKDSATVILTGQTEAFTITDATESASTITGGAANDTITLADVDDAKIDVIKFASTASAVGVDVISGLKGGAAGVYGDKLDFTDFLGATPGAIIASGIGQEVTEEGGTGEVMGTVTAGSAEEGNNIAGHVFFAHDTTKSLAQMKSTIVTASADNALWLASGAKAVMLHGEVTEEGTDAFDVYYITGGGGDAETVTKVATAAFDDAILPNFDNFA